VPASLRSENCSPSARNAVRVPVGISVRLRRNPQLGQPANRSAGNHIYGSRVLSQTDVKATSTKPGSGRFAYLRADVEVIAVVADKEVAVTQLRKRTLRDSKWRDVAEFSSGGLHVLPRAALKPVSL
jgi:hypothetical protein